MRKYPPLDELVYGYTPNFNCKLIAMFEDVFMIRLSFQLS